MKNGGWVSLLTRPSFFASLRLASGDIEPPVKLLEYIGDGAVTFGNRAALAAEMINSVLSLRMVRTARKEDDERRRD